MNKRKITHKSYHNSFIKRLHYILNTKWFFKYYLYKCYGETYDLLAKCFKIIKK